MELSNVNLLLAITFLHVVSSGLVLSLIPRHIQICGGNEFLVGVMFSSIFLFQKLNKNLLGLIPGLRAEITFSLWCCFIYYFTLTVHNTITVTFLMRILHAFTTHVVINCKKLIGRTGPQSSRRRSLKILDFVKALGTSIGAILGGYIFTINSDISTNAILASCLELVGLLLLVQVDTDDQSLKKDQSSILNNSSWLNSLKKLRSVKFENHHHFDCVLLKILYILAFAIYSSRVAFILVFNYDVGGVLLGYTLAYETMGSALFAFIIPYLTEMVTDHRRLLEHCMIICGFVLMGLFYAPTYQCHLVFFVVIIFFRTLVNTLLEYDVYPETSNEELDEALTVTADIINFLTPALTGFVCQFFGGEICKLVALLPVLGYIYVLTKKYLAHRQEVDKQD